MSCQTYKRPCRWESSEHNTPVGRDEPWACCACGSFHLPMQEHSVLWCSLFERSCGLPLSTVVLTVMCVYVCELHQSTSASWRCLLSTMELWQLTCAWLKKHNITPCKKVEPVYVLRSCVCNTQHVYVFVCVVVPSTKLIQINFSLFNRE